MNDPKKFEQVETYAKQSRLWLNIGLLLIVFALVLLVWLKPSHHNAQTMRLLDLTPKDVTRISITHTRSDAETATIILQKEGDDWFLKAPWQKKAKADKVAHLFTLLTEESLSRYPAAGRNLEQYQLDPGLVNVSFNDTELVFGMSNPMNYQRYVLKDNTIHLINETVFASLNSPAELWLAEDDALNKAENTSEMPVSEKNK